MTNKTTPIACPKCGRTDTVAYVEIRRMKIFHVGVSIEETEGDQRMTAGNFLRVGTSETREEIIDSMGNEEIMECVVCGAHFDVPKVDDIYTEEE
jgi:Zn ribbon nucleic-acid-binding protein